MTIELIKSDVKTFQFSHHIGHTLKVEELFDFTGEEIIPVVCMFLNLNSKIGDCCYLPEAIIENAGSECPGEMYILVNAYMNGNETLFEEFWEKIIDILSDYKSVN